MPLDNLNSMRRRNSENEKDDKDRMHDVGELLREGKEGKHSLIDLTIHAHGDTDIDVHHTVEDTAIVFGEALKQALGDKKGIRRFADATVPLDEALAKAVTDAGYKVAGIE